MIDNDDAYWIGFRICEALADYELCSALENGIRNSASDRELTRLERKMLDFIKNLDNKS